MIPKTFQNKAQKLSKSALGGLLEASWGLLGLSWGHLGKTSKKIIFLDLNLGAQMEQKIKKNDVKKGFVSRYAFVFDFLRFLMEFGSEKPAFLNQFLQ